MTVRPETGISQFAFKARALGLYGRLSKCFDVSLSRRLGPFQRSTETVHLKDGNLYLTIPIVASKPKQ